MDLSEYRGRESEQSRVTDLMGHVARNSTPIMTALDIGARDGHISIILTEHFSSVTALDLEEPDVSHEKISCMEGDITRLDVPDDTFDFVLCAEVLEHIPTALLETACLELERVTKDMALIGVPYKQDIRSGRTTCTTCGGKNPPWGHVNSFDAGKLAKLFPNSAVQDISYVGENSSSTNFISTFLLDLAGNPYGTYQQEEKCIHCDHPLLPPSERSFWQKVLTRIAYSLKTLLKPFKRSHANWIHITFKKHHRATESSGKQASSSGYI